MLISFQTVRGITRLASCWILRTELPKDNLDKAERGLRERFIFAVNQPELAQHRIRAPAALPSEDPRRTSSWQIDAARKVMPRPAITKRFMVSEESSSIEICKFVFHTLKPGVQAAARHPGLREQQRVGNDVFARDLSSMFASG